MSDNEKHNLKNNFLELNFTVKGAELTSLKSLNREHIWQANPKHWARHAPILFPIVGKLVDDEFTHKNITYSMGQHGFARDSYFNIKEKSTDSIVFELIATEKTKKIFPFDFVLQVKYALIEKLVVTKYTVINPAQNDDLYFSIGAHPAFNCPFEIAHQRNDYELVFDKELSPKSINIVNGLSTNTSTKIFEQDGKLMLNNNIFDNDALVFNPNPFSKVTFVHKATQKAYLSVVFKKHPYLGIWSSDRDAPFVCVEPWHGITDKVNHDKKLINKEGIIKLLPKKSFSCEYTIEVLES